MTHTAHDAAAQGAAHQPSAHQHAAHQPGSHADLLDLDAEVLADHIASITSWLPVDAAPRRIVDLGAGTGAGTFALLARFPEAHVTAVDASADHLQRLREKAREQGVADRVRTVQADLDAEWPDLGRPQMIWASASLHHLAAPEQALRQAHDLLAPGGLLVVVELSGFPRFLPADAPESRPGLEERCHQAGEHQHSGHLTHRGADWGPMLTSAGFTIEGDRTITVNVEGARSEAVGRYALNSLQRMRSTVAEHLPAEDLAALDELLDTEGPGSLLRRPDLGVRTERQVWAARRHAPAEYTEWRKARWEEVAGPNGKVKIVAKAFITGRDPQTFEGIPGEWATTETGALMVSAAAGDGVKVGGIAVAGTAEVPSGTPLEFPGGQAGFAGGADGSYGLIVTDEAALVRSGITGIERYPYDPAWVFQGEYREAPEGRRIEVPRLTVPRSPGTFSAPVDLAITVNGTEYVLTVIEEVPGQAQVIFTDLTNGDTTPEIGRWLVLPMGAPGTTLTVDFNRVTLSHHHLAPPVFTCPLAPDGNHLPIRIEAGERALVRHR